MRTFKSIVCSVACCWLRLHIFTLYIWSLIAICRQVFGTSQALMKKLLEWLNDAMKIPSGARARYVYNITVYLSQNGPRLKGSPTHPTKTLHSFTCLSSLHDSQTVPFVESAAPPTLHSSAASFLRMVELRVASHLFGWFGDRLILSRPSPLLCSNWAGVPILWLLWHRRAPALSFRILRIPLLISGPILSALLWRFFWQSANHIA